RRALAHVLIGNPVPTFPGHAWLCACPYRKNRFPLFRDMRQARVYDGVNQKIVSRETSVSKGTFVRRDVLVMAAAGAAGRRGAPTYWPRPPHAPPAPRPRAPPP